MIKYDRSKSYDYGYVDGLNGLTRLSSAKFYVAGYRAGRELFRREGGMEGVVLRKTIGYASASQRQRMERGRRYS